MMVCFDTQVKSLTLLRRPTRKIKIIFKNIEKTRNQPVTFLNNAHTEVLCENLGCEQFKAKTKGGTKLIFTKVLKKNNLKNQQDF